MSRLFKPVEWAHATNLYEVNVRQYTKEGSFNAFSAELPRLKDMGVEVLWFMPITPISKEVRQGTLGSYYACSDYTAVNPEFGTLDDFKNLVRHAHSLGLKVIIDWVANHTGWDHHWTKTNPEYYVRNAQGQFYDRNGWHDVIDLNYYNHHLRTSMMDAMKFWVTECDIDGFRCDMAHLVPLDFWRSARTALDGIKPLFWLAETETASYHAAFDASYTWNWMHQTEKFCRGEIKLHDLLHTLHDYHANFPKNALRLYFTSNHDENSWNGTEYEKYGPAARALAVFSCTWNGLPLIYSGQELPNHKRLKFFDKDQIEWSGKYLLHDFYKLLLNLRKNNPALHAGDETVSTSRIKTNADNQVFSFLRKKANREVLVVLNLSGSHIDTFQFADERIRGGYRNIFNNISIDVTPGRNHVLHPWDYQVLER